MTKLFIFKVENVNVALIVRKETKNKKQNWQLIKWNMDTNEFTEGQWLLNKQLWINGCSISPNGLHFGYIYNTYQNINNNTHTGISYIPYFTALLYGNQGIGRYYPVKFDRLTGQPINNQGFQQVNNIVIDHINNNDYFEIADTGLLQLPYNFNGNIISVDKYKLLINNNVIYDATNNKFTSIQPNYYSIN